MNPSCPHYLPVILYVEDHSESQELLRIFFKGRARLLCADDEAEAWQILRFQPVDLILMDIRLGNDPDAGESLFREIRAFPQFAHLPIIALTARAMEEDRLRLLAAGFDGFLAKPIDRLAMFQLVCAHLEGAARIAK